MIDVPKARAALAAIAASGADEVRFTRDQADQLLSEVERGQRALLTLTNLRTITDVAARAGGALA